MNTSPNMVRFPGASGALLADAVYVAAVLSAWARRYIKGCGVPAASDAGSENAGVTVSDTGERLAQEWIV